MEIKFHPVKVATPQTQNNKRIAVNTITLYVRMVVLMVANLYASRVVLKALGVDDYGLYSVVGGVVVFLGFINLSMTAASQRYLSFAHGRGEADGVGRMFNSVFAVHLLLGALVLIIGESVGLLYIDNWLNVAPDRVGAAHVVFQFSLMSFVVKTVTVPYHASIIANERMHVFAGFSLIEGGLQLSAALLITLRDAGRLTAYAGYMFLTVCAVQACYFLYSRHRFRECRVKRTWEKKTIKSIFAYSGWNLCGAFSGVAVDQGVNMVLNSFFGVVVNAARGIAMQVSAAVTSLAGNLQQAINPQIVKTYAAGEKEANYRLIVMGTRFCFCLMLTLALPVYFNLGRLLEIWLGDVPRYTLTYCRLVIFVALLSSFSNCLITATMATGNIRRYQIAVSLVNFSTLPLSVIGLHIWHNPFLPVCVMLCVGVVSFAGRLYFASRLVGFSASDFLVRACVPSLCAGLAAFGVAQALTGHVPDGSFPALAARMVMFGAIAIGAAITIGLSRSEQAAIARMIRSKLPSAHKS